MSIATAYASPAMQTSTLVALGSNQRHSRHGPPEAVLATAMAEISLPILSQSRIIQSAPVGPSNRRYANAAIIIETAMTPPELLDHLKAMESTFGRRLNTGIRWGARVLDLDIILWSEGMWTSPGLTIPHPAFRERGFVLTPAADIAPDWRDPVTGLRVRHLKARLDRKGLRP